MSSSNGGSNRIALVTGASRGIGAAVVRRLASDGFDIWLNYHGSHDAALAVRDEIEGLGRGCSLLRFDVSDEEGVNSTLEPLLEQDVPFVLVHNAGITRDTLLPIMRSEEWHDVIDVNLSSFFYISRLISKAMISRRQGRIIAITSVSGDTGQGGQVNYAASKAGLVGAVKSLARELARRNILVNAVSPGLIVTDMTKDVPMDRLLPIIPLGRSGTPEEVAGVVSFLAGEDSSYMTGQVIRVNGGLYI